ncbi:hypothetical protein TNCV_882741 [Trichonephila clavipes]|nr:hypothetical protein TNCV_882741 [Trichonephila clavipes]
MLKVTIIHLLALLGSGQQVVEGRSNMDYWNLCNFMRNVLLQFLKTMRVVAIHLRSGDLGGKLGPRLD